MKLIIKSILAVVAIAIVIASCDKNEINYGEFEKLGDNQSLLKVNYNIAYSTDPNVQITINGTRVSTLIKTRYPYPGGGYGTLGDSRPDYLTAPSGNTEVAIVIPKKGTSLDSVVLYKTTVALEPGKAYTLHLSDTATTTTTSKSLLAGDDFTLPDSGFVKYKFVNLMPSTPAVDVYYGTTLILSNIAYMQESAYFVRPVPTGTALAWSVRTAGALATAPVLATYSNASTVLNRRIYTMFATGYPNKTDAVRKPYVGFFLTR